MKVYKVKVNGKVYEVEVETVDEVKGSIATPVETKAEPAVVSQGSNEILAPIAGKVLSFKVNVGDTVTAGQTMFVIEAMKMENEIVAPVAGKVASINVKTGDTVDTDQVMGTLS